MSFGAMKAGAVEFYQTSRDRDLLDASRSP
jgi:hypothetical protein